MQTDIHYDFPIANGDFGLQDEPTFYRRRI